MKISLECSTAELEFEDKSLEITKSGAKRKKNDEECGKPRRLMEHERVDQYISRGRPRRKVRKLLKLRAGYGHPNSRCLKEAQTKTRCNKTHKAEAKRES